MACSEGSSWRLRPATEADADAVSEVMGAAGVAAWGPFLGEERVEARTREALHPADLVAVDGTGVLAFVAWDSETGEIVRLYTHPRGWGRGAGRALLGRALEALAGAGRSQAWLNTEERSERARCFYEGLGWREQGPPLVRDWHGAWLREPRYVKDLKGPTE